MKNKNIMTHFSLSLKKKKGQQHIASNNFMIQFTFINTGKVFCNVTNELLLIKVYF